MDYAKDVEAIRRIKDAFIESIEKIGSKDPELFSNGNFGVWATSALTDLLIVSAKSIGLDKEMVLAAIEDSWQVETNSESVLN